jgi:hypothetical protein
MHQHIRFFSLRLYKVISLVKVIGYLLTFTVVQGELDLLELGRVLKAQVHRRTNAENLVITQLVKIVGEVISADPHRTLTILSWQDLLSLIIVALRKHCFIFLVIACFEPQSYIGLRLS